MDERTVDGPTDRWRTTGPSADLNDRRETSERTHGRTRRGPATSAPPVLKPQVIHYNQAIPSGRSQVKTC